jgi:uncharacterized protein YdbL (DUF1318 family)
MEMAMKKPKRVKTTYTARAALATLADLRHRYVANNKGHRRRLNEILQHDQGVLARLRKNGAACEEFLKRIAKQRKRKHQSAKKWNVATEVVAKITGSASRAARQLAWKYGKVLDILTEEGVPGDETAKAIKARGIEKIIAAAKPVPPVRNKVAKVAKGINAAGPRKSNQLRTIKNDQEVLCGIYMRLSDRDRIFGLPVGASVKLEVIRLGQPKADLKVRRLFDLPASDTHDELDEDED